MTATVTLYTSSHCPYCIRAKQLLERKQVVYQETGIDNKPAIRQEMIERSGRRTVPQIWIGKTHVGGYDDLAVLELRGELDDLLAKT
ncbi:MAG: glutaredoxin 3 [Parahaliea sp.]